MVHHAHTFNPKNNSLEMRAEALIKALDEHKIAKASMRLANENKAHERLGTKEEIEYALQASKNTIEKGLKNFSSAEMEHVQNNVLSPEQAQELERFKRQELIKSSRTKSSTKDKDYSKSR